MLVKIQTNYQKFIESIAHDGGYASLENRHKAAKDLKIKNIVFTKL